ncbi:zinc finger MYM-type protein 1-like [Aphis gossypii]|uniref:zinc finger MYM-type protein 1-like n=1 Tax=Aphis gossypii TaxID=80765 RepID=UPI00215933CC|nr:zinc finger MYM-type protein 1-like [Aphis gossypii]XP_050062009.1 zinc finger MYM-type protein 1-like [Aphis gossypii]
MMNLMSQPTVDILLLLNTFNDPETITKLSARYGHYTSPEYQNDLIKTIASSTRKNIIEKIAFTRAYSILVDETKDVSKKEQLSFIVRFVDGNLNIHEKAIGCYHMKKCDAYTLSQEILNIAVHNKLDIQKCVAQCYDGASVMSGLFSGVQKRIVDIVPHAIYIHCHAHRLNLCLVNTIQNNNIVVDFFDTVQSLYKYLMNGHTRYELFMKIQRDEKLKEIHLERLVETRWSYWHSSLKKIQIRYSEIKDVLKVLAVQDDQAARAIGLLEEISTFWFILILYIMEQILSTIHCLSCQFQCSTILLPKAINLVTSTKNQLINLRSEENFTYIYNEAKICAIKNQVTIEKEEEFIRLRKKYEPSKKFEDFFIMSTLGQAGTKQAKHNGKNVKTDVLFNVIDR